MLIVGTPAPELRVDEAGLARGDVDQPVGPLGEPQPSRTWAPHTRTRKTFDDKGEGTERRSDWTRFEIGSALRIPKLAEDNATL